MGTRSLTKFYTEDGKCIVSMYRQFDGYPDGHGTELAEFLAPRRRVNGYSPPNDTGENAANGIGCLAAQVVANFKGTQIGNIYLYPPDQRDVGEEYIYEVHPQKGGAWRMRVIDVGWGGRPDHLMWEGDPLLYDTDELNHRHEEE